MVFLGRAPATDRVARFGGPFMAFAGLGRGKKRFLECPMLLV